MEMLPLVLLATAPPPKAVTEFEQELSEGSLFVLPTHTLFDGYNNNSGGTVTPDTIMVTISLQRGLHQRFASCMAIFVDADDSVEVIRNPKYVGTCFELRRF